MQEKSKTTKGFYTVHNCLSLTLIILFTLLYRLELLGDAFFKYVITVEIFKIHKRHREGQLSGIRASLVNNFHFKSVAIESKLVQYLRAIPISIGVEKCLWMPAGATFASYENGIIMDLRNENINYDISSDRTEFHISQATYLKQLRDHSMLKDGILNNEILGNKIQQNHNMELENHSGVTSGVATPRQVDSLANVDSIERNFMLSTAVRNLAIASTDPENLSVEIDADYDASTAGAPTSKHCLEGKEIVKEIDWQSMRFSVAEVKYKTVADLVESVVGAYFLCGGEESAIQVIKALGGWPRAVSHESSEEVEVTKESYCEEKTYRTASNVNNFYSEVNDDEEGAIVFPLGYSKNLSDLVLFGKSMSTFDSAKRKAENMSDSNNDRSSPVQQSSKYYEADSPSASGYYDPNDMVFDVGSNGKNDNLSLMSIQIAESCTSFGGIDSLNDSIAKKLGYKFADINLLRQAVTHSTPNHAIGKTYQRLEFLGDAVLDFVVVYALFQNKSNLQQGDVSLLKSRFTNNKHLAQLSLKFNLHHYILTSSPQLCEELRLVSHWTSSSKLIDQQKLNLPVFKIIADVFEAIIGAIYLDCGSSLQIMMDLVRRIELVEEIL